MINPLAPFKSISERLKRLDRIGTTQSYRETNDDRNHFYASIAQGAIEKIHSGHSNPVLAAVGKMWEEEILGHPLCKQFLSKRPALYLEKYGGEIRNRSTEVITIPETYIEKFSPAEIKAALAHDIGHALRRDISPKARMGFDMALNQRAERMADQIGVVISGDPEAMKSVLTKMESIGKEAIKDIPSGPIQKIEKWKFDRYVHYGDRSYPSMPVRKANIDKTARQIAEQGEDFVTKELARRIEKDIRRR